MSGVPATCLDCGATALVHRGRCRRCYAKKRRAYRDPVYLAQPMLGVCWICGLPIAPGEGSRDHIVPLAIDPLSTRTAPAHRRCNSARGAGRVVFGAAAAR